MFKITKNDEEYLEYFKNEGMTYPGAEYDFTFEQNFIIYHTELQHQTVYIAIDKETHLSSEVCRLSEGTFSDEDYTKLIPKLLRAIKYTGDRRFVNVIEQNPMDVIDLIFRQFLPENGFAIREEQIELSKKMYKGLVEKQVSICEAEVGTGKSMAYLVAAYCARMKQKIFCDYHEPITISTSSIELQRALIEKDIPFLSEILMKYHLIKRPITAVLRKGKEHYFCRARYDDYVNQISKYPEKYGDRVKFLTETQFGDKAFDLDRVRAPGYFKNRVCVKGSCSGCVYRYRCKYDSFREHAMSSYEDVDFQITNHNLYITSMKASGVLKNSSMVIIDEAHKFQEAAQDTFGAEIREDTIPKFLIWSKHRCVAPRYEQKYRTLQKLIYEENEELFFLLKGAVTEQDGEENDSNTIIAMTDRMSYLITELANNISKLDVLISRKGRVEVSGQALKKNLLYFTHTDSINIWAESDENGVISLCCSPKNISTKLWDEIWNRSKSHVLTSGTMSDGTSFEFFKRENGIVLVSPFALQECSTPSPFDYEKHSRLYIPEDIPLPDNDDPEYLGRVSKRIVELVKASNGHTAILFTSYKALQKVYDLTKDSLEGYEVICMTRSNKTAIADFKKSKNGVLFASGSMWEGVDCVGDCLSSVIIVRLPFPMRTAAMEEKKSNCGTVLQFIQEYAVPQMLIKLRQGAGRLIRSENDTGCLTILDSRAATGGAYRTRVLQTLEKYPLIHSMKEVKEFFREVKDPEYFE